MHKGRGHLGLLKPPKAPSRNAGAEARKEYEGALEIWNSKRHRLLRYASYFAKESVERDPPREPRAHELMERLVRKFALDKQKCSDRV